VSKEDEYAASIRDRNEDIAVQDYLEGLHEWQERPYRELFGMDLPTDEEINCIMQRRS
jgi:hypothetical protein